MLHDPFFLVSILLFSISCRDKSQWNQRYMFTNWYMMKDFELDKKNI
jgi:hypothetical protein